MGLLGNFVGNALGMQSAEEYTRSVEAADRLQRLQRANQTRINQLNYGVDKNQRAGIAAAPQFNPDEAFQFDDLQQPGMRDIPVAPPEQPSAPSAPAPDEGTIEEFVENEKNRGFGDATLPETAAPPSVPEFDSGQTVINPNDNQNIPNNQIPVPEFQNPDLSVLFPQGTTPEDSVSDEVKDSLMFQGMPWKIIDKNNGKVVIHNGVEYDIKDVGDGSYILTDRYGRPNYGLTQKFTEGRQRGVTNTEIVPRTNSYADDLAAATVDNAFVSNALKSVKENKFRNGITGSTVGYARQFGVDVGEALGLLAVESNFGNVKFDNRASTRGPLQIQNLAYKDVKAFYQGDKPAGVSDAQWAAMTAAVAKMPRNHSNLTDTNDQIAAGLLYYKMIELKGVDKRFQAAAYYDGYGKYIGINDISDVKNFSGPNTLESVTKYNSAVLGLKQYMTQLGDYYYGDGTPAQRPPEATDSDEAASEQAAATAAASQTATEAAAAAATTESGYEIRQEDGPVVFKDGQPVLRFAGPNGQAEAEAFIAQETGAAPKVVVNGKEEPSVATTGVDPDITKFLQNPPNIGIETSNILKRRQNDAAIIQQRVQQLNDAVARNNQKVAEYERMAQVARISGDLDGYERYRGLADTANESSRLLVQEANNQNAAGVAAMQEYDEKLLLVQGAQALQDLSFGSTARAGAVLSAYSGLDIQVRPRSDGLFDIVVQGQVQATYTNAELADKLQSTFSQAYRDAKNKRKAARADAIFESDLDTAAEIKKIQAEMIKVLTTDAAKAQQAQELEIIKNSKGQIISLGEGKALIRTGNGIYIFMDPNGQIPDANNPGKFTRGFVKKTVTSDEADALVAGSGSGDAYATN